MRFLRFLRKLILHLFRFRLFSPKPWENGPSRIILVAEMDTGGGWYRPTFRTQNPASDPNEPTDESNTVGTNHGWANCTMSSGAMVLDYHTQGRLKYWGGKLRHSQGDMEGGTDLYDVKDAWLEYGEALSIRSGAGWAEVEADRIEGRALILQGEGGTPGAGTFTGGHAIAVLPETNAEGKWLIGNPECTAFEWVSSKQLREWAQAWNSGISWARSDAHPLGGDEVGMRVLMLERFNGKVRINVEGASAVQLADGEMVGIANGTEKEAVSYAELREEWSTPGGTTFPAGTKGYIVGGEPAFVFENNCEPLPISGDCDDQIAEAVEHRDSEWVSHLTPD